MERLASLTYNSEGGELHLSSQNIAWKAYIVKEGLFYVKDKLHPIRRWQRSLKQYSSRWDWSADFSKLAYQPFWECQLLDQGISQKNLSLLHAKLALRAVLEECLFELSGCEDFESSWHPGVQPLSKSCTCLPLTSMESQTVFNKVIWLRQQWQSANLQSINPNLSPVLIESKRLQEMPIPDSYLTGQFTLWDIARQQGQSIVESASALLPYVQIGTLQLRSLPDLSPLLIAQSSTHTPASSAQTRPSSAPSQKPLIACIDDSPVLAHTLTKMLQTAGYRTISIQEPMRGFSQLIEQRPSLILLDLLLPNADGYSVCKFLRDTPVFAKTPIIILTGQNTIIDRARALSIGATAFLGKPPQPQELLAIIQKHLSSA